MRRADVCTSGLHRAKHMAKTHERGRVVSAIHLWLKRHA